MRIAPAALRRPALLSLALAGTLALSGCFGTDTPEPAETSASSVSPTSAPSTSSALPSTAASSSVRPSASATSSTPSASVAPTTSAAPTSATPTAAPSTSAAPTPSAPSSTASASPGMTGAAGASTPQCSGLTGPEALGAARKKSGTSGPFSEREADFSAYDDCAVLSAIGEPLGGTAASAMDVHIFHHGKYVGKVSEKLEGASGVTRVDEDTVQLYYVFSLPGETTAEASGRTTATVSWDAAAGGPVESGNPGADMAAASASASAQPSATGAAGGVSKDEFYILSNSGGTGFCIGSAKRVMCFGKHDNAAILPATGAPTRIPDLQAAFPGMPMGLEGPQPNSVELAPGQSHTHRGITCTATVAGFDCTNTTTGASISVAGPKMSSTRPTR
ncbi:LppP/LprE family lipoprotein [Micrococcus sp.]|uniref:LppP/LprE family lipoprotein n=1 Tax=Micrococcus sp. TaxID=1271 RepID=UPI002A911B71|nr:LppP/LprE family lipoprotein [Micrococcus sp.]MDY6055021.1 LppP/LprE family lipoprotein [Micrococcus sp.]